MPTALNDLPSEIRDELTRLTNSLVAAAGKNLVSLILFGGLARGRFRPGRSDVNIVLVLEDVSPDTLLSIAGTMQRARRAVGVEPMILSRSEVASSALDFPTKFLDIRDHHIVLVGSDPFRDLEAPRERIALRVAQELRNLLLRLRHRYVEAEGDAAFLKRILTRAARPLAIQLAALLRLSGGEVPADDRTVNIFEAAAVCFGLDREVLQGLAALRHQTEATADVNSLAAGVMENLAKVSAIAENLTKGDP